MSNLLLSDTAKLTLLLLGASIWEAPLGASSAADESITYKMKQGDTLIGLAEKFMLSRDVYKVVQKQNHIIDPYAVPIGKTISIPRHVLAFKLGDARFVAVRGTVLANASQAIVGQKLREGATITTGRSSFATLALSDGSHISLPSNSDVQIRRLRTYHLGGSIDFDFDILKGGARSTVTKKKSPDDRFRVRTPRVVSAVRGTDFQTRIDPVSNRDFAEVVEGSLAVDVGNSASTLTEGNGLAVTDDRRLIKEALPLPPNVPGAGKVQADRIVSFATEPRAPARFTIGADSSFIEQIADVISADGSARITDLPNGSYFIRARAISSNGIQGLPVTYAFKRRLNGVTATASKGDEGYVFRWASEGGGKTNFHFQLFANAQAIAPVVDEAGLSGDRITVSDLPNGTYRWRVGVIQYLEGEVSINWTAFEALVVSGTVSGK